MQARLMAATYAQPCGLVSRPAATPQRVAFSAAGARVLARGRRARVASGGGGGSVQVGTVVTPPPHFLYALIRVK